MSFPFDLYSAALSVPPLPWHGYGMTSVNQTRPHCLNQMGKIHSKNLSGTEWQGNGMGAAWAWHAMCKSAFRISPYKELRPNRKKNTVKTGNFERFQAYAAR